MLHLKQINLKFNKQVVFNNVSYSFPEKGLFFLLGESGSGKSSLFNVLVKFQSLDSGEIFYGDLNLTKANSKIIAQFRHTIIGLVFQNYNLIANLSVKDNFKLVSGFNLARYNKFVDLLEKFGVKNLLNSYPFQISGGEQQRVALARTLSFDYQIILADEPTGSLDSASSELVMNELYKMSKKALVIVITHDQELTNKYKGNLLNLKNANIIGKQSANIYFRPVVLYSKKTSFLAILKTSIVSIKERKLYYLSLVLVTSFILLFLLLSLSVFNGIKLYIDFQTSIKLDGDYFSIYKIENNQVIQFEDDDLDLPSPFLSKEIDIQPLINSYFAQVLRLDNNAYYEVKIINGEHDGIKVNNLFYDLFNQKKLILNGVMLVPFHDNISTSYEQVLVNKQFEIEKIIEENEFYNVPKIYITKNFFYTSFDDVELPLISKKLNLEMINFAKYHLDYQSYLGFNGIRLNFISNEFRKEASDFLLLKDNFFSMFETKNNVNGFEIHLNDEIFESTLKELIESGNTIVILIVFMLLFTLVNLSSLIFSFNFRKRVFELAIIKAYGADNLELITLVLFEIFLLFAAIVVLVFSAFLLIKYLIDLYLFLTNSFKFNYLPYSFKDASIVVISLIIMLFLSSIDPIIKVFKLNVAEALHHD